MSLDPELLEILACPACKGPLERPADAVLRCPACRRDYPVEDGIPNLIVS